MKRHNFLLAFMCLVLTACTQKPQVDEQLFKLDFIEQNALNGAVIDKTGDIPVLNLGANDGYYDLTPEIGKKVASLKDFTVSVYFNVSSSNDLDGYGHFLFAFSKLEENKADDGPYMAMRLNEQRFETSTGGWEHEEIVMQGGKPERDVWVHALFRQAGKIGELYLDGQLIGRNDNMPVLAETFTEAPAFCWIGRAPFHGDKFLADTKVADFRIYEYAISDELLKALTEAKKQLK